MIRTSLSTMCVLFALTSCDDFEVILSCVLFPSLPSQIAVCASRKISRNTKNFIFWIFERVIVPCHLNDDGDDDELSTLRRDNTTLQRAVHYVARRSRTRFFATHTSCFHAREMSDARRPSMTVPCHPRATPRARTFRYALRSVHTCNVRAYISLMTITRFPLSRSRYYNT